MKVFWFWRRLMRVKLNMREQGPWFRRLQGPNIISPHWSLMLFRWYRNVWIARSILWSIFLSGKWFLWVAPVLCSSRHGHCRPVGDDDRWRTLVKRQIDIFESGYCALPTIQPPQSIAWISREVASYASQGWNNHYGRDCNNYVVDHGGQSAVTIHYQNKGFFERSPYNIFFILGFSPFCYLK